jgi:hypothetical protein
VTGIADTERQQVVDELERLAAAGRVSPDELADRVRRARTVLTRAGLDGILLDLPATAAPTSTPPTPSPPRPWALPGAPTTPDPPPATAPAPAMPPTPVGPVGGGFPPPPQPGPAVSPSGPPVGGLPPPPRPARRAPRPPDPPIRRAPRLSPPPAPGKRYPLVGLVGLSVIAIVSLWAIANMADDATDDLTGSPGFEAGTERRDPPAAAVPTTEATTTTSTTAAPTGTTLPHLDGWDTLVVGQDIQPGLLMSSPADEYCGWARARTEDEGRSTVSDANGGGGRPVVEVLPTDQVLLAQGCGAWVPYAAPAVPATTMGDGDWLVGSDIEPGRYHVTTPDSSPYSECYWARADGFTHEFATHIETNLDDPRTEVELADGERFTSDGCGTWARS